ncbi:FecCD family ABC transporter permease [Paenibacillus sacheonensis]|uniref:Iron chelate uptake ABC transporter family permease subunit n=1 Tax=Paenibacillus sacheonensis TaxID=742054 RepID=A0A7X5C1B8_9BACL|nr:iron ABC transporter permease [Paenibacillus sacheonensis]MBM7565122.1 iron complex transport system permease protein [Paenibacillus sacheonensis]NBC70095.1 iron chelate uptake ABC transporter family permease subunit [Paenibacillus sacheonensis]
MNSYFNSNGQRTGFLLLGILILLAAGSASLLLGGSHTFTPSQVYGAYTRFDGSNTDLIIRNVHVPRMAIAAVVGASLAVAGALMQAMTRNPLASPSVMGINSGAALAVVIALAIAGSNAFSSSELILIAFGGAAVTAAAVFSLGAAGRNQGETPIRVTLAGSAVAAFASAWTSGILLKQNKMLDDILLWIVGSVSGRELHHLTAVLPYTAVGLIGALLMTKSVNVLSMGDETARGLGLKIGLVRTVLAALVVLLAGSSVAIAGPIAFVGVIIPHVSRFLVGHDYRWIVPYSIVLGATLLLAADTVSRFILRPEELPVGVATALIGVPFFIYVARRKSYAQS